MGLKPLVGYTAAGADPVRGAFIVLRSGTDASAAEPEKAEGERGRRRPSRELVLAQRVSLLLLDGSGGSWSPSQARNGTALLAGSLAPWGPGFLWWWVLITAVSSRCSQISWQVPFLLAARLEGFLVLFPRSRYRYRYTYL